MLVSLSISVSVSMANVSLPEMTMSGRSPRQAYNLFGLADPQDLNYSQRTTWIDLDTHCYIPVHSTWQNGGPQIVILRACATAFGSCCRTLRRP